MTHIPIDIGPELLRGCWSLSARLADRLFHVMIQWEQETRIPITVISGFRTRRQQEDLARSGRPTAPFSLSTHTVCPSEGADLKISTFVTTAMKAQFGRIVVMNGLRWGGGSAVDPKTGIPSDWQHVDTGPRRA